MQRILLVEDSEAFQAMVASAMEGLGVGLTCVGSAEDAKVELERNAFDLILLDIMLPGEDGYKFCSHVRSNPNNATVPIFFLTGKGEIADKVAAFEKGADDYIVKPFDLAEFRARVSAKLTRVRQKPEAPDHIVRGDFKIDVAGQKVAFEDKGTLKTVSLTPAEFRILYYLVRHPGETVTGRQLMEAVWGKDLHVVDQNLYTHMHSLRKKLGNRAEAVESVRGGGYRFTVGT